ncbi:MAG: hypothetical protein ACKOTZ_03050, partial [Chloroflexota bacterium]
ILGGGTGAAAAGPCPDGAKHLGGGVCQVTFRSTPVGEFSAPAGATQLEALLGGAGTPGVRGYAGGGGEVRVVSLDPAGSSTVTVGTIPETDPVPDTSVVDGATTETARGGRFDGSTITFKSGNGNAGYLLTISSASGGGAGGSPTDEDGGQGSSWTTSRARDHSSTATRPATGAGAPRPGRPRTASP